MHLRRKHLLLIENNPWLGRLLSRQFEDAGFEVACSSDWGSEALTALAHRKFDLILLHCAETYEAANTPDGGEDRWTLAERDTALLAGKSRTLNAATPLVALTLDLHGAAAESIRLAGS